MKVLRFKIRVCDFDKVSGQSNGEVLTHLPLTPPQLPLEVVDVHITASGRSPSPNTELITRPLLPIAYRGMQCFHTTKLSRKRGSRCRLPRINLHAASKQQRRFQLCVNYLYPLFTLTFRGRIVFVALSLSLARIFCSQSRSTHSTFA